MAATNSIITFMILIITKIVMIMMMMEAAISIPFTGSSLRSNITTTTYGRNRCHHHRF